MCNLSQEIPNETFLFDLPNHYYYYYYYYFIIIIIIITDLFIVDNLRQLSQKKTS